MLRRTLWFTPLAVAALAVALFVLKPSPSPADPVKADPAGQPAASTPSLPVAQAILYSSGVGYFQREGTVEGNVRIDLTFPVQDVNDLLKSMVLQDLGGGVISAVSYDSQAPIEKTLQSFAVNLTGNPGFGAVLGQALRGEDRSHPPARKRGPARQCHRQHHRHREAEAASREGWHRRERAAESLGAHGSVLGLR